MHLSQSQPSGSLGKQWGELDSSGQLINTWIYQLDAFTNQNKWMSDVKSVCFNLSNDSNEFLMKLDTRYDYLLKTINASFASIGGSTGGNLWVRIGGDKNIDTVQPISSLFGNFYSDFDSEGQASINNVISTLAPYMTEDGVMPGVYLVQINAELNNSSLNYKVNGLLTYQLIRK